MENQETNFQQQLDLNWCTELLNEASNIQGGFEVVRDTDNGLILLSTVDNRFIIRSVPGRVFKWDSFYSDTYHPFGQTDIPGWKSQLTINALENKKVGTLTSPVIDFDDGKKRRFVFSYKSQSGMIEKNFIVEEVKPEEGNQ